MKQIFFNSDGTVDHIVDDGIPVVIPPSPAAIMNELSGLLALPQPMRTAVLTFAKGMVVGAGDLWDALVEIPVDDPSHASLQIITDAALTAALPLVT